MEISKNGEIVKTDNDELAFNTANDAPHPPQDAPTPTRTTAAISDEGGDDDDVGAKDNGPYYVRGKNGRSS